MNNISNITQKYERQTLLNETADKQRSESRSNQLMENLNNTEVTPRDDKVSLSQASKIMQLAKNAVAESPDIREDKVMTLKKTIADNQYGVAPEKIADAFIGSIISEII